MTDEGRTWLVTGASGGFGRALVEEALTRGGRVAATSRDPASLSELKERWPDRLVPIAYDAGDADAAEALLAEVGDRCGPVDVLVNDAGFSLIGAVEEVQAADLRSVMDVNFFAPAALIRAVLPAMRQRRSGAIVNFSSVSGVVAPPGSGAYAAAKFALEGLSDSLRLEVLDLGIKVMIVEPGPFRTGFFGAARRFAGLRIDDYASVSARRDAAPGDLGTQPGDPVRGARIVADALDAASPTAPAGARPDGQNHDRALPRSARRGTSALVGVIGRGGLPRRHGVTTQVTSASTPSGRASTSWPERRSLALPSAKMRSIPPAAKLAR